MPFVRELRGGPLDDVRRQFHPHARPERRRSLPHRVDQLPILAPLLEPLEASTTRSSSRSTSWPAMWLSDVAIARSSSGKACGQLTLRPRPTTTAGACGPTIGLGEDAAELAIGTVTEARPHEIVGPLQPGRDASWSPSPHPPRRRPPPCRQRARACGRDAAAPTAAASSRRRRPHAVGAAPAGGLVVGDEHRPVRGAGACERHADRHWSTRSRRPTARRRTVFAASARFAASLSTAVNIWPCSPRS